LFVLTFRDYLLNYWTFDVVVVEMWGANILRWVRQIPLVGVLARDSWLAEPNVREVHNVHTRVCTVARMYNTSSTQERFWRLHFQQQQGRANCKPLWLFFLSTSLPLIMLSSSWRVAVRSSTTAVATRALATDAAHKPPIDIYGLHGRYANAAYTAASKAGVLDKVESEMIAIKNTAASSPTFKMFLDNPLVSRDEKEKRILDMLQGQVTPVTLNLMLTLAGNARLSETTKIVDTYSQLMKAKRGEVEATIISAEALSKAQLDTVAAAMKTQVGEGKKVILSSKVDPSIMGGLQVQIGDKFLDLSVGSRIDAISRIAV